VNPGRADQVAELRESQRWDDLAVALFEAAHEEPDERERIVLLVQLADVFETQIGDPRSALVTLLAALRADYTRKATIERIDRLASAHGYFEELAREHRDVPAALRPLVPALADAAQRVVDHWQQQASLRPQRVTESD
jgi:hypothetical protein